MQVIVLEDVIQNECMELNPAIFRTETLLWRSVMHFSFLLAFGIFVNGLFAHAVIGGYPLNEENFPYIVRLWNKNLTEACTGTIVGPHVIITATHCYNNNMEPYIYFKSKSGALVKPEVYSSGYKWIEDAYEKDMDKMEPDLAILYFKNINFTKTMISIANRSIIVREFLLFAGFGVYDYEGNSNFLNEGLGRVTGSSESYFFLRHPDIIAGPGDSGGPIMLWEKPRQIVGVFSRSGKKPGDRMDVVNLRSPRVKTFLFDLVANNKKLLICGINLFQCN